LHTEPPTAQWRHLKDKRFSERLCNGSMTKFSCAALAVGIVFLRAALNPTRIAPRNSRSIHASSEAFSFTLPGVNQAMEGA
jgi:hypothetical protein